MIRTISICILAAVSISIVSAKPSESRRNRPVSNCDAKFNKTMEKYSKKKYTDVQLDLGEIKGQCLGHAAMDSVLYYLGMSYLLGGKPEEGRFEFEQLARDFPQSAFFDEAAFRVGHCVWSSSKSYDRDQTETLDAIRVFGDFVESHSGSVWADSAQNYLNLAMEKLAKKEFMSAEFYDKTSQFDAAIIYYKAVITDYPASQVVPDAMYALAQDLIKVSRNAEALVVLDDLINRPALKSDLLTKARNLRTKVSPAQG